MSTELIATATALSQAFMPAEREQNAAAIQAAQSLIVALEARRMPEFSNTVCDAALEALVRGVSHAVEADTTLRQAHRKFARALHHTRLPELGWGCDSPDCGQLAPVGAEKVTHIRAAA
jgi:hypothetical protein